MRSLRVTPTGGIAYSCEQSSNMRSLRVIPTGGIAYSKKHNQNPLNAALLNNATSELAHVSARVSL